MTRSATYLAVLLGVGGVALAVIAGLNLVLVQRALSDPKVIRLASDWQQQTRGITYSPPITVARPFKALRLADRVANIDTMVFGASTVMGIEEKLFPAPRRLYNFALVSNPTSAVVGEAEYVAEHYSHIKTMVIALDWSIGFIYFRDPPQAEDLSPSAQLALAAANQPPFLARLKDALSSQRVESLGKTLKGVVRFPNKVKAFRQAFFEMASDESRCANGDLGRDFDIVRIGACVGYRYDGSWTFADQTPLRVAESLALAKAAASHSSKFSMHLIEAKGEPNRLYLDHLAALSRRMAETGGRTIYLLPPLVPTMEREILAAPVSGVYLRRTKTFIDAWARSNGVVVIDAGESERYGCRAEEFLDEHHAFETCYEKLFARFWRDDAAGRAVSGLYRPGAGD